jgi:hypothetical protein
MVASLVPAAAGGKENGCTATAAGGRSTVVLLLLLWPKLPLLVQWAIAPVLWWRMTQLSCGWGIHHMVF